MNYWNSTIRIKVKAAKGTVAPRRSRKAALRAGGKLKGGGRMKRSRHSLQESRWSKAVRERDNNTCQFPSCGKQGKSLDTHHIAMRSLRPDLRFDVHNGITLCRPHHSWVSRVGNRDEAVAMGLLNLTTYELAKKQEREVVAA